MGMFDHVICKYPLPGDIPEWAKTNFQTKDLDCVLDTIEITEDGRLKTRDNWEGEKTIADYSNYTGTIDIYASNVCCSGPGIYTREGEPAHYLEYSLTFVNGKVTETKELENRKQLAAPASLFHENFQKYNPQCTEEDRKKRDEWRKESLVGRIMTLKYGGSGAIPYEVEVISENDKELVVRLTKDQSVFSYEENLVAKNKGDHEIVNRWQRGSTLFDSVEEAMAYEEKRKREWQEQEESFKKAIEGKTL